MSIMSIALSNDKNLILYTLCNLSYLFYIGDIANKL